MDEWLALTHKALKETQNKVKENCVLSYEGKDFRLNSLFIAEIFALFGYR